MRAKKVDQYYLVRIDKGEEVISALTEFCKEQNIQNATITALGAVEHISCGYYAVSEKKYYFKEYNGLFEVLNATGNVILKDGSPFVHLHATFSDTDNHAFGGHVESMRVGVVLEVVISPLPSSISRIVDEDIGLALMDFG